MPDLTPLTTEFTARDIVVIGVQIVLILLATLIALRFSRVTVSVALARLFEREAKLGTAQALSAVEVERRRLTLEGLIYRALRVIVLVIAFLMVLDVLRLDIGPAIAGVGIVGLAISLGTQNLVRDYVAGSFVLIENQYSRGDIVSIAGVTGTVEDISLRRTSLRDFDGTLHTIPHGLIGVTSNLTRSWATINIDIPVSYEEDLAAVRAAIDAAGEEFASDAEWKERVLQVPRVARVENLGDQGMTVKVLGSVAPTYRFEAAGELRRRILAKVLDRDLFIGWRAPPARPKAEAKETATAPDKRYSETFPPQT
jgi:small-conductance mechanosensitive channel